MIARKHYDMEAVEALVKDIVDYVSGGCMGMKYAGFDWYTAKFSRESEPYEATVIFSQKIEEYDGDYWTPGGSEVVKEKVEVDYVIDYDDDYRKDEQLAKYIQQRLQDALHC